MNIAQLSEQLKDVPQNRLIDYARNPNSVVPQFLALAEIQRRQHLAASPQPPAATVAEDVLAQAAPQQVPQMPPQMPPQMAPQMPPQAPPQMAPQMPSPQMVQQLPENQPGVAQLPTGMPQGMASGGIVAFAGGDLVDDEEDDADELQTQKDENHMMSLIAGLRTKASNAVAAVPRAIESATSGIQNLASNLPKSYEAAKREATTAVTPSTDKLEDLLSKVKHLESRGRSFDEKGNILTSPKGAEGSMQVMRHTQKDPGFGVVPARDRSPQELERVGKDYFVAMLNEFKDPKLAAMAYNWGPGNVKKWLSSDRSTPVPRETSQYASNFAKGGIAHFVNQGLVDDEDTDNDYLNRSRSLYSGVRSLADALTTPKNYDLYDMYQRNVGIPVSKYANKVINSFDETPEEQARRFRSYSMTPNEAPTVGFVKQDVPVIKPPTVVPLETSELGRERARALATAGVNKRDGGGLPSLASAPATAQDFRDFDQASALFEAQSRINQLENPPEQYGPKEPDVFKAAMLRAAQDREDIKAQAQTDKYLAMLQGSLGMMAGTSPYAMANIGQGGMQGVAAYANAKKQRSADLSALDKYELGIMRAKELSEIKNAQLDVKKAELSSLDENRKDKIALAQERLANMPTKEQKILQDTVKLIQADDQIPMLMKQQAASGAPVGSPDYEYFNKRIKAIRESYFKNAGIKSPIIEAIDVMAPPAPAAKEPWYKTLFGGSSTKPSSGLTEQEQALLNKYPTKQ